MKTSCHVGTSPVAISLTDCQMPPAIAPRHCGVSIGPIPSTLLILEQDRADHAQDQRVLLDLGPSQFVDSKLERRESALVNTHSRGRSAKLLTRKFTASKCRRMTFPFPALPEP